MLTQSLGAFGQPRGFFAGDSFEGYPQYPVRIDLVSRQKLNGLGRHFGVALEYGGTCQVFDNQLGRDGVGLVTFEEFERGRTVRVLESHREWESIEAAMGRLEELLLEDPRFDHLRLNCEHAARYVFGGKKKSQQVDLVTIGLAAVGVAFVLRAPGPK